MLQPCVLQQQQAHVLALVREQLLGGTEPAARADAVCLQELSPQMLAALRAECEASVPPMHLCVGLPSAAAAAAAARPAKTNPFFLCFRSKENGRKKENEQRLERERTESRSVPRVLLTLRGHCSARNRGAVGAA